MSDMTSKPKFTAGPWSAEGGRISWKIMPPEPGYCVAYMDVEHSGWWPDENPEPSRRAAANAALIAAAPDGYTIIAALHDELLTLPEADPMRQKYFKPCADYLAKAGGRS